MNEAYNYRQVIINYGSDDHIVINLDTHPEISWSDYELFYNKSKEFYRIY